MLLCCALQLGVGAVLFEVARRIKTPGLQFWFHFTGLFAFAIAFRAVFWWRLVMQVRARASLLSVALSLPMTRAGQRYQTTTTASCRSSLRRNHAALTHRFVACCRACVLQLQGKGLFGNSYWRTSGQVFARAVRLYWAALRFYRS